MQIKRKVKANVKRNASAQQSQTRFRIKVKALSKQCKQHRKQSVGN